MTGYAIEKPVFLLQNSLMLLEDTWYKRAHFVLLSSESVDF